jgi:hypothetical protein
MLTAAVLRHTAQAHGPPMGGRSEGLDNTTRGTANDGRTNPYTHHKH